MTDSQLIAAARRGDSHAWRELYARWMPWVWRYAYALVHDPHVAEDVTSEAMTAWVKNFDNTGHDAAQAAAWLRSVVRHKSADYHRRAARGRRATERVALTLDPAPGEGPDEGLLLTERRTHVLATLGRLTSQQRLLLEWKYAEGHSVRQMADRLGATEKSVEAGLYRARREFRRVYLQLEPGAVELLPATRREA